MPRYDPNFKIIVRSDVIATTHLDIYYREQMIDDVVSRSNAYAEAGADAIFVMALTVEELEYFADRIKAPLVGIFATIEPIAITSSRSRLPDGYRLAGVALYGGARAGGRVEGTQGDRRLECGTDKMINDEEFFDIVGLEKYGDLWRRYKIP